MGAAQRALQAAAEAAGPLNNAIAIGRQRFAYCVR